MLRRCRTLIVALAVALQAIDAIVGAWGHHHGDKPCCLDSQPAAAHVHHGCSHHHEHATPAADRWPDSDNPAQAPDDCSLCRHFSQPVLAIAVTIEVTGCELIRTAPEIFSEPVFSLAPAAVAARGPPALV